jgi:hypothetical protein
MIPNIYIDTRCTSMLVFLVIVHTELRSATIQPRHSPLVFSSLSIFDFDSKIPTGSGRLTSFSSTLQCAFCIPDASSGRSDVPTFLTYLFSFHTLLNSFVLTKNSTPLFSSNSELFRKNTRGVGYRLPRAFSQGFTPRVLLEGPPQIEEQYETTNC